MSKEKDAVNPAARDENAHEHDAASTQGGARDHDRSTQQGEQAGQNHDMNDQYDPSNGKRHDQLRRNDKRGQMGG